MFGHDHYVHRLRAACVLQPHLNRHQLAALDLELAISRASSSPEAHMEASGHLFALAKATALDRAANALDTARRHADPWSAAAAAIEYSLLLPAANHVEFYINIQSGHEKASPLRALSAEINAAFLRLFLNLLHVHTSNYELAPAFSEIESSFQILRQSDPAFLPHSWLQLPRYNQRLPWHSPLIHDWLEPYWQTAFAAPPPIPPVPPPTIQPGPWGTLIWPAAEPLHCPADTSLADTYLQRQSDWPDAFLASHWQATKDAQLAARSPIAQYAVAQDREAICNVESTRNMLSLSALLAPLRAIANHGWEQSEESQDGVEKAIATTLALTGHSLDQLRNSPRIQHFLTHNLQPRLELGTEDFGALYGESGFDLLRHAAAWYALAGRIDFTS